MNIEIENELMTASRGRLHLGVIYGQVRVRESDSGLIELLEEEQSRVQATYRMEDLAKLPELAALRDTYKALGKKPQKYRGSNEALLRRIVKGVGLYYVNNVVDINNLISLKSRRSVGSYDLAKTRPPIRFGVGIQDEPYAGIGRGTLNIAHLPVFRDETGAFGSPTSDSERTRVSEKTQSLWMTIIGFDGKQGLQEQLNWAQRWLERFAEGKDLQTKIAPATSPLEGSC